MAQHRGIHFSIALLLVAAIALAGYRVGAPLHQDYSAAHALKPIIAQGHRLVPVRYGTDLRGEARQDFHCFTDGQCFYALDKFRSLYPAYNDLEDEALLNEVRLRGGP